ncbi:membrane protein [Purpureocillium lavendulum]|uniref:Membrane protein n=1 Tax=Purpureocillium lavendulum TaxID=1247861 RepID=A0AB34FUN3_9HYPO|nr:membrane protein [Purpureocillium lavendulum]
MRPQDTVLLDRHLVSDKSLEAADQLGWFGKARRSPDYAPRVLILLAFCFALHTLFDSFVNSSAKFTFSTTAGLFLAIALQDLDRTDAIQAAASGLGGLQERRFHAVEKRGLIDQILNQILGGNANGANGGVNNGGGNGRGGGNNVGAGRGNNGGGGNGRGGGGGGNNGAGGGNGGAGGGGNRGGNGAGGGNGGAGGGNRGGNAGGGGGGNRGGNGGGGGNNGGIPGGAGPGTGGNRTSAAPAAGAPATAPGFQGLRITTVTQTVQGTEAAQTVTRTVQGDAQASTVTITELASTVTQTVTAPCQQQSQSAAPQQPGGGQNSPAESNAPATPNRDGNGVGVTSVPVPDAPKPTTNSSAAQPAPEPTSSSSSGGEPGSSPSNAAPDASSAPAPSDAATATTSETSATSSTTSSTTTSAKSVAVGGAPADASAPLESAVTTPNAGVAAPVQPLTLSGLSLSSKLDLGKIAQGTPAATLGVCGLCRFCTLGRGSAIRGLGGHLDDVDDPAEAVPLDAFVDDDAAGDGAEALETPFTREAPDAQQVHNVRRATQTQRGLRLAADYESAAAGGTDEVRDVADKGGAAARVGREELGVAYLEAHAARDGGHARLGAEVEVEVGRQIQGDDGYIERQAGVLKGLFGERADGEDVVDASEGGEAIV